MLKETVKLANGVYIPCPGFGTWKLAEGDEAYSAVKAAVSAGYRHIDTAFIYRNEKSVGKAVRESDVGRETLFVTSKVWDDDRGYDKTLYAFERSIKLLGLEYLDLYLIHWPACAYRTEKWREENLSTWRALERLYKEGRIRAIGVSNFLVHHLEALIKEAEIAPMVDQIEFHPGHIQKETLSFCQSNNILVEGWSPLGRGSLTGEVLIVELAAAYNRSPAQICLRWALQNGVLPLPKSVTPERIVQNLNIFDFELSKEDMNRLNSMPSAGYSGLDPDKR